MLVQLEEAGSDIDYETFIIFDERSLEDDTVLVVEKSAGTLVSVRMASEIVDFMSLVSISGKTTMQEEAERAAGNADGVLRDRYQE